MFSLKNLTVLRKVSHFKSNGLIHSQGTISTGNSCKLPMHKLN